MRVFITGGTGFAVRMLLGEFADTVLFSQRMDSSRLRREGFKFQFHDIMAALKDIYQK